MIHNGFKSLKAVVFSELTSARGIRKSHLLPTRKAFIRYFVDKHKDNQVDIVFRRYNRGTWGPKRPFVSPRFVRLAREEIKYAYPCQHDYPSLNLTALATMRDRLLFLPDNAPPERDCRVPVRDVEHLCESLLPNPSVTHEGWQKDLNQYLCDSGVRTEGTFYVGMTLAANAPSHESNDDNDDNRRNRRNRHTAPEPKKKDHECTKPAQDTREPQFGSGLVDDDDDADDCIWFNDIPISKRFLVDLADVFTQDPQPASRNLDGFECPKALLRSIITPSLGLHESNIDLIRDAFMAHLLRDYKHLKGSDIIVVATGPDARILFSPRLVRMAKSKASFAFPHPLDYSVLLNHTTLVNMRKCITLLPSTTKRDPPTPVPVHEIERLYQSLSPGEDTEVRGWQNELHRYLHDSHAERIGNKYHYMIIHEDRVQELLGRDTERMV